LKQYGKKIVCPYNQMIKECWWGRSLLITKFYTFKSPIKNKMLHMFSQTWWGNWLGKIISQMVQIKKYILHSLLTPIMCTLTLKIFLMPEETRSSVDPLAVPLMVGQNPGPLLKLGPTRCNTIALYLRGSKIVNPCYKFAQFFSSE
jgi:hypothetical protein